MVTAKHGDKLCLGAAALAVLLCLLLWDGGKAGLLLPAEENSGYVSRLFDKGRVHTIDLRVEDWEAFLQSAPEEAYVPATVEIDGEEGVVYVNGEALYEPYINDLAGQMMYTGDLTGAFTVPEGEVFVMGDNRNGSSDSRKLYEIGTIPYEKIVGKAIFRIFPFSRVGSLS